MNTKDLIDSGYYWVLIEGYTRWTPCLYVADGNCWLPAGMGDTSRDGVSMDEIAQVGWQIEEPGEINTYGSSEKGNESV